MDLQTRQQIARNHTGFLSSTTIAVSILLITLLGYVAEINISTIVRGIVILEVVVFNSIMYKKMQTSGKYVHCCCSSMIVVYLLTLMTSKNLYMYVVVFPITIMVMIFADDRLALRGWFLAVFGNLVFSISLGIRKLASPTEIIIAVMFSIVGASLALMITRLQNQMFTDALQETKDKADMQLATSKEIVELASKLNQKFESAKEVSEALNESMETNHASVSRIAESTKSNAKAIEQQTSQTSDIQMSIQEVGREAKNITGYPYEPWHIRYVGIDAAKNMGDISEQTNATVEEGVGMISRLKDQAAQVVYMNTETRKITTQLNETIQGVQEIVETILGISNQTNLLALNASIEAARAGEAGKGFAVVADEIRELSENTRMATEEIGDIITKLTQDAERASGSMTRSAEYAERQNEMIEETGAKLVDIKNNTGKLYESVRQVNRSVENIVAASARIMDSITRLSQTEDDVANSSNTALTISDTSMEALKDMNVLLENISDISSHMEQVAKQ